MVAVIEREALFVCLIVSGIARVAPTRKIATVSRQKIFFTVNAIFCWLRSHLIHHHGEFSTAPATGSPSLTLTLLLAIKRYRNYIYTTPATRKSSSILFYNNIIKHGFHQDGPRKGERRQAAAGAGRHGPLHRLRQKFRFVPPVLVHARRGAAALQLRRRGGPRHQGLGRVRDWCVLYSIIVLLLYFIVCVLCMGLEAQLSNSASIASAHCSLPPCLSPFSTDMEIGEKAKIHCTPDYAYGSSGFPDWGINPNSALIFEIEVLSVKDGS